MLQAYKKFFSGYFDFKGRTTRSDFVWVYICNLIISIFLNVLHSNVNTSIILVISVVWGLLILIPSLAMAVRRLRDAGLHWAVIFVNLIPLIGSIVFFVIALKATEE